ncbi:hypothetical protein DAI22_08g075433 [Oryza sativa Japonica Group]|nr:hypothetical protein DAI22_08g075433 [Oryza sativa Japonica Group]
MARQWACPPPRTRSAGNPAAMTPTSSPPWTRPPRTASTSSPSPSTLAATPQASSATPSPSAPSTPLARALWCPRPLATPARRVHRNKHHAMDTDRRRVYHRPRIPG